MARRVPSASGAGTTAAGARAQRATFASRGFVALAFAVIAAIGGFGTFALVRTQQANASVVRSFERANTARAMDSVVDTEHAQLLAMVRASGGVTPAPFMEATASFDRLLSDVRSDAGASDQPIAMLSALHHVFVYDARRIVEALRRKDRRTAEDLLSNVVTSDVEAISRTLSEVSSDAFREALAMKEEQQRFVAMLLDVIVAMTAVGFSVMTVVTFILGRYRRSADDADAAKLLALEQAALTDSLTGLGNHRAFYDDFAREVARAKRHGHELTMALIDVDDFKMVNDRGGHSRGDAVLQCVGRLLQGFRAEDRAYRVGGDEFAVLLVETGHDAAQAALRRVHDAMRESGLGATLSIGYASLRGDALDVESYELADAALYEAKRRGRNTVVSYAAIAASANVFSVRKAEAVRLLIERESLAVAFQPIWDIASTRPLGFEALARPNAETGLAGPQEAFDVAERIRKVPELDAVCMRHALRASANLPRGSTLFVNVAPASFTHESFEPERVLALLRIANVAPEQVVIELTERRIEDAALIVQRAAALRRFGIRIALDDTGSGHAGLAILSKLHVDFVKIDRALILNAIDSSEARGVLAGIIAIARETGCYLIAEGIENGDMLEFVRTAHVSSRPYFAGIRGVQGYLLGRPEVGPPDARSLEAHRAYLTGAGDLQASGAA
jgi:diguanylate cyclase (GGDEF)-like protein